MGQMGSWYQLRVSRIIKLLKGIYLKKLWADGGSWRYKKELWADGHFKIKLDPPPYSAGGAGQMEGAGGPK